MAASCSQCQRLEDSRSLCLCPVCRDYYCPDCIDKHRMQCGFEAVDLSAQPI